MSMQLRLRRSDNRPRTHTGWLDSRHSFSFGQHHDPEWMGFGTLRVLNEDIVGGGGGFAPHRHANMEIVSIVLAGALSHRDSTGESGVIRPGDVQIMSAGHGVEHAEFNASPDEPVAFLQIWIQPDRVNAEPRYAQAHFDLGGRQGRWQCVVGGDALPIRQGAAIFRTSLDEGQSLELPPLAPGRGCWLQVVAGSVQLGVDTLRAGDGFGITGIAAKSLHALETGTQLIRLDVPA